MTENVKTVVKFEPIMYATLCKAIPGGSVINVSASCTELQAGYQLGVQAVLQVLRDGFVYDR